MIKPKDRFFDGPGGRFHYIDWGEDGVLTCLAHATGFCSRTYQPLIDRLAPYLRVLGLDDRGHGRTTAPAIPAQLKNWEVFYRDLEFFLESRDQPAVVIGHSRGGVAGLAVAARRPDLIRALILLDPTVLPHSWAWWAGPMRFLGLGGLVPIAARARKRRNGWSSRQEFIEWYQGRGPFKNWAPGFLDGYAADGLKEKDNGQMALSCDPAWESRCFATFCHNAWGFVDRLSVPTLLLYGKRSDTFLPAAVKRFQRLAPRAVIQGFPESGHFLPMEQPDAVAEAVIRFLRQGRIVL